VLKVLAAAASLGVVALVWRTAERLGRDPVWPALFVGLSPLVLVHVVSAAHNEALVMLLVMAGVYAFVCEQPRAAGALPTLAAGVKASAGLVLPYLVLGSRPLRRAVLGVLAGGAVLLMLGLVGFGTDVFQAFGLLSQNQGRSSRLAFPYLVSELVGGRALVRALFGLAFACVAGWTLWRVWRRGADPIRMAAWATVAILVATAWLVPWYLLWLLPLAALAADRRLTLATVALSGWVLAIGVPGIY
jgi:alpha-1,6-mannosyltransferase